MKLFDILELDLRKKENAVIIQKALRKIKPFANYSMDDKVPFCKIEKLVILMCEKYDVGISVFLGNDLYYHFTIYNSKNNLVSKSVYGTSMYDVFAKAALYIWAKERKSK